MPLRSLVVAALLLTFGSARAQPTAAQRIPPIGKLVDAGGHRLHLNCAGKGSPTVILESGANDFSMVWALIQSGLAPDLRACSYDRAGYAWSDAGPLPRTMAQIVLELHSALANAGEKGPFVLVGAGLGGPILRIFANAYPKDAAGMVQVEGVTESGFVFVDGKMVRLRETAQKRDLPAVQANAASETEEPLVEKTIKSKRFSEGNPRTKLPPELQHIWLIARSQAKYNLAASEEFSYLPEEMQQLYAETEAHPQPLGKKPLIVLTRELGFDRAVGGMTAAELENDRKNQQAKLASISSNSRLVTVKDSGIEIHLYQPGVVAAAIREVAQSVRTGAPLTTADAASTQTR